MLVLLVGQGRHIRGFVELERYGWNCPGGQAEVGGVCVCVCVSENTLKMNFRIS